MGHFAPDFGVFGVDAGGVYRVALRGGVVGGCGIFVAGSSKTFILSWLLVRFGRSGVVSYILLT